MSKKVIGALLALIMVFSVFSLSALAIGQYDWEPDAGKYNQTWGLADGGNGVVQVTLTTDYEVGPISFVIEGVSLEDVNIGNGYYGGNASIDFNKTTGLVLIYPNTGAPVKAQKLNNAVVATFTYTGNATPAIKDDPKQNTADGMNGTLIASRCPGEYVNGSDYYVGQTCEILAFGQAPKPEEPTEGADLATSVTGVVIDTNKKFGGAYDGVVYGIPAKDGGQTKLLDATYYNDFIQATNGGSLEYVKTSLIARPASWGTGTTVKVKDAAGTVLKTYVLIIIGDVDGDSQITNNDITPALNHAMNPYLPDLQIFAANTFAVTRGAEVNKIASYYTVDNNDISALLAQVMTGSGYDVAKLAEGQQTYNTNYQ